MDHSFLDLANLSFFNRKALFVNRPLKRMLSAARINKVLNKLHFKRLMNKLVQDDIGLIYSNTITNGEILTFLSGMNCPVITHVHELEYSIHQTGVSNLEMVKRYTKKFIVVSEAVKNNLIVIHGIPSDRIVLVPGFIPAVSMTHSLDVASNMRHVLNIPSDAFIVGSSGMGTWVKGKDLFIQLAIAVIKKAGNRPIHFVWVGGYLDVTEAYQIKHDLYHAGIMNNVHFIEHVTNPLDYYCHFDSFAMLSREDSFPLVNLEAAVLGKPIVCFDSAGGSPEFVEDDAGFVVPYLDIDAMADKLILLSMDNVLRQKLGTRAAEKVTDRYNISVGAPKILDIIEQCFA